MYALERRCWPVVTQLMMCLWLVKLNASRTDVSVGAILVAGRRANKG